MREEEEGEGEEGENKEGRGRRWRSEEGGGEVRKVVERIRKEVER